MSSDAGFVIAFELIFPTRSLVEQVHSHILGHDKSRKGLLHTSYTTLPVKMSLSNNKMSKSAQVERIHCLLLSSNVRVSCRSKVVYVLMNIQWYCCV